MKDRKVIISYTEYEELKKLRTLGKRFTYNEENFMGSFCITIVSTDEEIGKLIKENNILKQRIKYLDKEKEELREDIDMVKNELDIEKRSFRFWPKMS